MKSILFPTDFSETAKKAFIYALHIAGKWKARITTLHVYKRPDIRASHMPKTMQEYHETLDLHELARFKKAVVPLKEIAEKHGFSHLEIQHVLEEGETVNTILKVAEQHQADMIVMGTTGARGLKNIFLGSIAGEILEHACCPVLVVPEKAVLDGKIDKLAFTTIFEDEEKKALQWLIEFGRLFDFEIHCINVNIDNSSAYAQGMEELKREFNNYGKLQFHLLEGVDILNEITNFLEENQVDIVAMVNHKRTFLQAFFDYSKTKRMSRRARTPVLSFQSHSLAAVSAAN